MLLSLHTFHTPKVIVRPGGTGRGGELVSALTHRLVAADGIDLGPEHDSREDQEEETLEGEEDEEDDS